MTPRQRTTHRRARPVVIELPSTHAPSGGIEAWRGWRLVESGGDAKLQSLTASDTWDGPCFTADVRPTVERRRAPTGIHAYATPGQLQSALRGPALVYGQVTLRGEVCVHETGYRAEHARIDRLYLRACGRHPRAAPARTGLLLLDLLALDNTPHAYCACDALEPHEWLAWEDLEALATRLGDRYQCDVTIDAERPRIPTFACPAARRARTTTARRA